MLSNVIKNFYNFDVFYFFFYLRVNRSLETIGRIKLKFRGRRVKPKPVKTIQLLTTQNIKE